MYTEVRSILIERAKLNAPIAYGVIMGQIGLNVQDRFQQNTFYEILAEISTQEHVEGRPLLSVMVKRQGGGPQGFGFFKLAEELGFGDANTLSRGSWAREMQEACHAYWSDKKKPAQEVSQHPEFFTSAELDVFRQWATKVYDKNDSSHRAVKNMLLNSVWKKTVHWADQVKARVEGYETFSWRMWSKRGWRETPEGKVQCAIFKDYSWARIFKKGDRYKDIFFTVGYDAIHDELVYKLDYYFESNAYLNPEQQEICARVRPADARWNGVKLENASGWDDLINDTVAFIERYDSSYDELMKQVWGSSQVTTDQSPLLQESSIPDTTDSPAPVEFQGREIDWEAKSREAQAIGRMGEEIVLKWEQAKLIDAGRADLAEQVEEMWDGEGYDIKSFNTDGSDLHIEVKTTTAGKKTPFFITAHERRYSREHSETYCLFRLFDLNQDQGTAKFFRLNGNLDAHLNFEATVFRAAVGKIQSD